ncbi:nucleotidyl transferase AbiEii/AbiGii toxin family protein [Candidatus Roizmanbacteria bacterium]|nr:nucleotidyl transferase AbiEii/AbiGii toxin family protein [Candidatus Roizmanbacteria bacterium]
MNNIVTSFDQILSFAKSYGLPLAKKRAILREYLQVKILEMIYREKISRRLFFVGGTSLRLLWGLDRFSEDLDFDFQKDDQNEILSLLERVHSDLGKQNIAVELYKNITGKKSHFEYRFSRLLFDLKLSLHQEEKLMIKFDFESYWKYTKREIILLNRYGFITQVVSTSLDILLAQKIIAYLRRKDTQARDLYDIIWLVGYGAELDNNFVQTNKLPKTLIEQAKTKFEKEKNRLKDLKLRLKPFLVDEKNANKLDLFTKIL